jgi:hypothetical protein
MGLAERTRIRIRFKQIPGRVPVQEIQNAVQRCCRHQSRQLQEERWWPTTRDVYAIRKMLQGLVIGPIDKNPSEFLACCPCLITRRPWTECIARQRDTVHTERLCRES